jgi:hypothetical protein
VPEFAEEVQLDCDVLDTKISLPCGMAVPYGPFRSDVTISVVDIVCTIPEIDVVRDDFYSLRTFFSDVLGENRANQRCHSTLCQSDWTKVGDERVKEEP